MAETSAGFRENLSVFQIFIEFLQIVAVFQLQCLYNYLKRFVSATRTNKNHGEKALFDPADQFRRLLVVDSNSHVSERMRSCFISVIIPTYNEEGSIIKTIHSILKSNSNSQESEDLLEIIISDGGSTDNTLLVCQNYLESLSSKIRFIIATGGTNRAESQNIGAKESKGGILLFLHADSILPNNWIQLVRNAMIDQSNLAGCFKFELFLSDDFNGSMSIPLDSRSISKDPSRSRGIVNKPYTFYNSYEYFSKDLFRRRWVLFCIFMIEWGTNIRSRFFSLPYGDQALFFRRSIFLDCFHGFQSTALLEDYDLIRIVRKYGKIVTVSGSVKTSARRWEKNGFIWNTFLNQVIIVMIILIVS